ncbi:MAG TPA: glycosyltransferase family 39 protein [Dehalococcoidia bacterium]|nr:glycosyltransferase family 39 protein [Dehalococcoidia bacterium]
MNRSGAVQAPQGAYLLVLALLAALYLATVLPHLGDDPIAGGDEGWIISASAKLTEQGIFGTDLFAGFYGSEDHYYFNLPLHHLVLSGVFQVIGVGLEQGRLVSVVFGLAALILTYALGRRLAGPAVGVLAAALLVLLRLNLAPFSGLTLTDLGATVRYDLITVPYGLAAVLVLLREGDEPQPLAVALAGSLVAAAAMTQFLGAFFGLPLALFLLTLSIPFTRRLFLIGLLTATALVPLAPYGVYLAQDWDDFRGQARTVEQETDLLSSSFYLRQLENERDRYITAMDLDEFPSSLSDLAGRPSARLALVVVGPLAALSMLWRGRFDPNYRLLGLTLLTLAVQLALFESTKRFVYWVVAVPFLCIALADLAVRLWQWRLRFTVGMLLSRAAAAAVLLVFMGEGLAVAAKDVRDARDAPSYADLGRRIEASVTPGAVVLGDNRLWPAMRATQLRSLLLVFYYTNPRISHERTTDVPGALARVDPDFIVLSPLSREILTRLTPEDGAAFERYISSRTERVTTIEDKLYGPHEVLRVRP